MLMLPSSVLAMLLLAQTPPANPACSILTAAESASLIGAGGKTISVTNAATGASCMVQNGDKVITILTTTLATPDAASGLWAAKERIVNGEDLAGWPAKAYTGALKDTPAVGLAKGKTFLEVRVTDPTPTGKGGDLASRLQTVMKAVAARLP